MNAKKRAEYERRNLIRRAKLESSFMRPVFRSLKAFNMKFAAILIERGIDACRTAVNKETIDARTGEVIKALYVHVGVKYATWTYNEIQRSATKEPKKSISQGNHKLLGSQINFDDKWATNILDYFRMYLIDKAVVPITLESKERIMEILDIGTREGWSLERMAKELETDRFLLSHTRLVVRTETAKAAYYGRRIGAVDSGYETTKEWISAKDSRTRHSHRDMDGVILNLDESYNVPIYRRKVISGYEKMRGPGDPQASAENVCNCRCTEAYQAKRDASGRLIKKPVSRVSVIQPGQITRPNITVTI